jgi:Fe2+ or Zn2+ uptake regulation protein
MGQLKTVAQDNNPKSKSGRKTRNTVQRRKILIAVRDSGTHVTAETVYERVKIELPEISLSTVYRNLKTLADQGKVSATDLGSGMVFEAVQEGAHHHLVCLGCNRIIPFNHSFVEPLFQEIEKQGFELVTSHLALYGYCPNCQKSRG